MSADRGWLDSRCGGGVDEHLAPVRPQVVASLPGRGRRLGSGIVRAPHRARTRPRPGRAADRGVAPSRRLGPARLAGIVGVPGSTVHRVLVRHGVNRLRWMDRPTGRVIRRIETSHCGELVHIDVKKLARIPDGGGHKIAGPTRTGRCANVAWATPTSTPRSTPTPGSPTASSPASRTPSTASRSFERAVAWFANQGITIERILTDNGIGYRATAGGNAAPSSASAPPHPALPARDQRQSRTIQPHPARRMGLRPALELRAGRARALDRWLHRYNHHRHHTAIGGPPASRVTNLAGQNT